MPTGRTSSGGFVGDQLANLIGLPEFQGARLGPLESCSAAQLFRWFAGRLGHVNKAHQGFALQCTDYPCTVQRPREPECSTKRFFVHRGFHAFVPLREEPPRPRARGRRHRRDASSGSSAELPLSAASARSRVRQKANTRDLIIDVPGLIAFATSFYTSPERRRGSAHQRGDVIRSAISGIGEMTTLVRG